MSFKIVQIPNFQAQIEALASGVTVLAKTTASNTTAIAVNQQAFITAPNYTNNTPAAGNSIDNLYNALAANALITAINPGRTITFNNNTLATNLDLYLTVGGTNPVPITLLTTLNFGGPSYVWPIPQTYNWCGNFTTMPSGIPPPQYNAGPTVAEFGLNQYWSGSTPDMRDTFDISTVPSGIGTSANNGPRSAVVALSIAAGFTGNNGQQANNYNVGVQIIPPPPGVLTTQTVTCNVTNGDSPNSIGYPNDTAYPKQQTGDAAGSYIVNFIDPVVNV